MCEGTERVLLSGPARPTERCNWHQNVSEQQELQLFQTPASDKTKAQNCRNKHKLSAQISTKSCKRVWRVWSGPGSSRALMDSSATELISLLSSPNMQKHDLAPRVLIQIGSHHHFTL